MSHLFLKVVQKQKDIAIAIKAVARTAGAIPPCDLMS